MMNISNYLVYVFIILRFMLHSFDKLAYFSIKDLVKALTCALTRNQKINNQEINKKRSLNFNFDFIQNNATICTKESLNNLITIIKFLYNCVFINKN